MEKILIAFFSHSGNTKVVANNIKEHVGGDVFEIRTVESYQGDYDTVIEKARGEKDADYRPKLETKIEDIDSYDVVFIGYPNWWSTMPMAVFTFLEEYDFSGKTIIPFCTHGGSNLGQSMNDIKGICENSNVLDGLAIWGKDVHKAQGYLLAWLNKLGMKKKRRR